MVIKNFDSDLQLGDLRALLALKEIGTVTRAAEQLGLSQSALSYQLERTRQQLGDPLFVRVGNRMVATPRVDRIAAAAAQVLRIVDTEIRGEPHFDPSTSEREFRISVNEIGAIILVPKVMRHLARSAPRARLLQSHVDPSRLTEDLESGAIDLTAGHVEPVDQNLVRRLLYRRDYVCIAAEQHPRIRQSIGLRQLSTERLLQNPGIPLMNQWLRERIEQSGYPVQPPLLTQHVAAIPFIVAQSDLIAIVPREVFELFRPIAPIKVVRLPMKVPPIEVHQYWHPRMNGDPGHRFFRELVYQAARE
jgi:DNA-binding transcriptional LysR family regulator